jgi:quercetin dioxygenase-like cupin family protein
MKGTKAALAAALVAAGLAGACGVETWAAQKAVTVSSFTRSLVLKQELGVPGREAVQVLKAFSPGAAAGRHTHPGEVVGYVLEGTLTLEVQGQAALTLKAGDSFFIPAGSAHDVRNTGKAPAKVLATYIVEKGKPIVTSVK